MLKKGLDEGSLNNFVNITLILWLKPVLTFFGLHNNSQHAEITCPMTTFDKCLPPLFQQVQHHVSCRAQMSWLRLLTQVFRHKQDPQDLVSPALLSLLTQVVHKEGRSYFTSTAAK